VETVPISVLKAKLSEYISRARAGQEVVVTDRGVPVARLVQHRPTADTDRAALEQMEREGLIRLAPGPVSKDFLDLPAPDIRPGALLEALLADRDEGP